MSELAENVKRWGVVGAGGAGFPTYAKLASRVSTVIVNAAECEPLLHKDKEIMRAFAGLMIAGLRLAMRETGATQGVIGVKAKYDDVIAALRKQLAPDMRIVPLRDYYPTGDEFILTYEVTGKAIPPGGLPRDVDCLVQNVETLVNLARAKPVTEKYLSVVGAVNNPVTIAAPIGTPFRDCIAMAGGAACAEFGVLVGGVMMGKLAASLDQPVTRTTGALIVLPEGHDLLRIYRRTVNERNRIGRAACDQCCFCTEFCPRYLLGHPIEPHKAMRSLGFLRKRRPQLLGSPFCCECNLCTLWACPESLDPREACIQGKVEVRANNWKWEGQPRPPHAVFMGRNIPVKRLMARLNLTQFNNTGPLLPERPEPSRLEICLKQHVGAAAIPTVKVGRKVKEGDVIAEPPPEALGVPIHASVNGRVSEITDQFIAVER